MASFMDDPLKRAELAGHSRQKKKNNTSNSYFEVFKKCVNGLML